MYVKLPQVKDEFGVAAEYIPTSVRIHGLCLEGQIGLNYNFRQNKVMFQEKQRKEKGIQLTFQVLVKPIQIICS